MKKALSLILVFCLLSMMISGCINTGDTTVLPGAKPIRLSDYVGVWTDEEKSCYYRFTSTGLWYRYNNNGEVEVNGEVDEFDGEIFRLVALDGEVLKLYVSENGFKNQKDVQFQRTDSPSSLVSSEKYESFFELWYEDGNLAGNILTVSEPDIWKLTTPKGEVLFEGNFYAYADESEYLYLYLKETGAFYARLSHSELGLLGEKHADGRVIQTTFCIEENSKLRSFYFKEKGIVCDYAIDSGLRLLRNGGAAFNDAHDYKKMPVSCGISTVSDTVDENNMRQLEIKVNYEFKRQDLPYLSGNRIYNSVRFSQYDYYTGELLNLDDSTGNEDLITTWEPIHDDVSYKIECQFSSSWQYSDSDDILVRWQGTYILKMPVDYDGFVICLRPVYNSYSAQVSASIQPEEGTLMMEDLGEDVTKAIFCRIERYAPEATQFSEF